MAPTSQSEKRGYARINCGAHSNRVGIRYLNSIPVLNRQSDWRGGLLLDVSRSGLRIVNAEQMYPGEKARFALEVGGKLNVVDGEVMWCRRYDKQCFSVGIRLRPSE